jgi:hypothetical protein
MPGLACAQQSAVGSPWRSWRYAGCPGCFQEASAKTWPLFCVARYVLKPRVAAHSQPSHEARSPWRFTHNVTAARCIAKPAISKKTTNNAITFLLVFFKLLVLK